MRPRGSRLADWFTAALAIGVLTSVGLLSWFGYRAIDEWRKSSFRLAESRSREAVDLLREAFYRDMAGVQQSALSSPQWDQFASEHPHEINDLVASAFARYPYPETFFTWRSGSPFEDTVFFNRADRSPSWSSSAAISTVFPVVIVHNSTTARDILEKVSADAARTRELSFFEIVLNGVQYQVVARLTYSDAYREHLSRVVGFTINLPWVRTHYFSDLTRQVWNIGPGKEAGLALSITDQNGHVVAGSAIDDTSTLTHRRKLDLIFVDPDSETYRPRNLVPEVWTIAVTASADPSLSRDVMLGNRILAVGTTSALALAIGLFLIVRAQRVSANLVQLRSEFVSTVTHELKTPIATISAAAETLSRDRLTGMSFQSCGRIVKMEARRLSHLVDNLLAYSRITDIADSYTFEPVEIAAIFNDVQQDFEAQLDLHGFELDMNIEPSSSRVMGDRLALRLLFDNLVDNAVKYSGERRTLILTASGAERAIRIQVVDSGIGIPPEEIPLVTRKFVRGHRAPVPGSGLGLAIASRIARDHGGTLQISSVIGVGTTVTVSLPRA